MVKKYVEADVFFFFKNVDKYAKEKSKENGNYRSLGG